jgi:hypothetical protein
MMDFPILFLHFLAVSVLIGSLFPPLASKRSLGAPYGDGAHELRRLALDRARSIAWGCLAVLFVSGLLMLYKWHVGVEQAFSPAFYESRFGRLLVIKLLGTILLAIGLFSSRSRTGRFARLNLLVTLFLILVSIHVVR